jgi:hypothetical protein
MPFASAMLSQNQTVVNRLLLFAAFRPGFAIDFRDAIRTMIFSVSLHP